MMVEVLVTILVVSLGLFGILAVVINSLKLSSSSTYRTIAAQQANALAEVIRANPPTLAYDSAVAATGADSLVHSLNSDQGTAGRLLHDQDLYKELTHTVSQLDSILQDVKQNPRRYTRGMIKVF